MQAARLHNRQDPFHETAASLAIATEAAPTPQHRPTYQTLHVIIGWLNALMRRERPQRTLQLKQILAELRDTRIFTQPAFHQRHSQPTLERFDQRLHFFPRDRSTLKRMPRGEEVFDDSKPPAAHKYARAAVIHYFLEIAFQVRPAKLPTLIRYLQIDMPSVAMHNAIDFFTQDSRQAHGAAFGVDDEHRDVCRGRRPQPAQFAPDFPTRLVGEFHVRLPHCFERLDEPAPTPH